MDKLRTLKAKVYEMGYNCTSIAKKLNISREHFSRIVSGKRTPSQQLAKKILDVLFIDISDLCSKSIPCPFCNKLMKKESYKRIKDKLFSEK